MAVVTAFEFNDFVAARVGAGNADRCHDRLCSGVDKADFVQGRDRFFQHFCELHFIRGRRAEQNAVVGCFFNGSSNMRMGKAGNDRAVCRQIINVAVAVHVIKVRAFSPFHGNWGSAAHRLIRAGRAVYAADNMLKCFFIQAFRF